jgi:beta-glucanase (GH16 family)
MVNSIFSQVDVVYSKLVWNDEFDINGAVESSKWHYQTLLPNGNSWYNGELQHYTNINTNSSTNNGFLNIVAKKENFTDQSVTKNYTSARLNSKFAFTYGRVDVRAKMPIDKGTWPAIWLLGQNINEPGGYFTAKYGTTNWPACGEIDIVECGIFPSEPSNYFASAIHTTSSAGSTVNKGGRLANNLGTDFHVYSMNWSPNQITFLLDNVAYYTYNPAVKNASTWPFNSPQYLLLNIAMGGVAGSVPSTFTQAKMEIDYVRIYQKEDSVPKDTLSKDIQPPHNFTARIGNISSTALELLMNAEDTSNILQYTINYNNTSIVTNSTSKIEKSINLYNLNINTDYTIEIIVKDTNGNQATPIKINAKTLPRPSCSGFLNTAQLGSFSNGYSYMFDPFGNELIVQYEFLDTDKSGVVGFLLTKMPSNEFAATYTSSNKFSFVQTRLSAGSSQEYAIKFAYAGGNTISNYYTYKFSENCSSNINNSSKISSLSFQNPVSNSLKFQTEESIEQIILFNSLGQKVFSILPENNSIDISHLPEGLYHLLVQINGENQFHKLIINK